MKKITTTMLIAAVVLLSSSCKKDLVGEGPITTETRSVPAFTSIDLQMNGNVYYTKSTETKIELTAKETIHDMLETTVSNNRLLIRYRNGKNYDNDPSIRINVYAPEVSGFLLNTSGNIHSESDLDVHTLLLRSNGSGYILLKGIAAQTIDAQSMQSGRISAQSGTTINETLKTGGSANIDLSAVSAQNVWARTTGSGDIRVKVSDNLEAVIDGSGDIFFRGYPHLSSHISGTGKIQRF